MKIKLFFCLKSKDKNTNLQEMNHLDLQGQKMTTKRNVQTLDKLSSSVAKGVMSWRRSTVTLNHYSLFQITKALFVLCQWNMKRKVSKKKTKTKTFFEAETTRHTRSKKPWCWQRKTSWLWLHWAPPAQMVIWWVIHVSRIYGRATQHKYCAVLHTSPSNAPIVNNVNSKLCHLQVS